MWCSNHHIICSGLLAAASSSISPVVRLSVCLSVCACVCVYVCMCVCALRFVGHFSESKLRLFFCGTFFQKVNLEYFVFQALPLKILDNLFVGHFFRK